MAAVLLDTCAILFLASGEKIVRRAQSEIDQAAEANAVFVSPASAWEVGMLAGKSRIQFSPDPMTWFRRFVSNTGIAIAPLSWETMLASWQLPDWQHTDPADRLLVATAREMNMAIVTRDRQILDYAKAGNVKAIAC